MFFNRRTLKYLEFLTGASVSPCQKSASMLSFSRLNFDSSFLDVREADSDPESQLMMDLIRQEEGRGGRRIKKFSHKVKHLTNSSRNIFNDKCALLMRKIDEHSRSSSSGSRSLSSVVYHPSKDASLRSESNSMLDVRRPKTASYSKPLHISKTLQKTTHPIVRSVSDDSAMKQPSPSFNISIQSKATSKTHHQIGSATSICTQSSPDVCLTEQCACCFQRSLNSKIYESQLSSSPINKTFSNAETPKKQCPSTASDQVVFHFIFKMFSFSLEYVSLLYQFLFSSTLYVHNYF